MIGAGTEMDDLVARHLRACEGFTAAVEAVGDRWWSSTPCLEWDARALVEHVIGFHDVLLLRPLWLKPQRPKINTVARWTVTVAATATGLQGTGRADVVAVPGMGSMKLGKLVPMLTSDVLVHTWDLAKALGVPTSLDPDLATSAYEDALKNVGRIEASGLFDPPVPVDENADVVTKLVALLGRDPDWPVP